MRNLKRPKEVRFRLSVKERELLDQYLTNNDVKLQTLLHSLVTSIIDPTNKEGLKVS